MRIAIVTPWYGSELFGGAERLAWELSRALARVGSDVEVLTTTCRSFQSDWGANYHRAGARFVDGVTLRRFKVDSRDRAAFSRANAKLVSLPRISLRRDTSPLADRETQAFFSENISSAALLAHLKHNVSAYDAVVFVPYLYGTTVSGLPLVADRAFIVPCLHDEAYAYLEPIRSVFAQARGLLFNSDGEAEVAADIFGPAIFAKSSIIGHAVDVVVPPRVPITIGSFAPHRSRYILYLGRQDSTKNVNFLLDAFAEFRKQHVVTSLQLVLAGPQTSTLAPQDGVINVGPVREDAKSALLTYARALAQPSTNESFSRAIYESWFAQRPVIVHGACRATTRAVEDSGGGWVGTSRDDWVKIFTHIDEAANDTIDLLGQRGLGAATENGSWDAVAVRTLESIEKRLGRSAAGMKIDQLVSLGQANASRFALALGSALTDAGADAVVVITQANLRSDIAKIVVHASDSERAPVAGDAIVAHVGNIYVPAVHPPILAVNVAVLQTLAERGISARLLPEPVDPAKWALPRNEAPRFTDGRKTILSIAPLQITDGRRLLDMLVALVGSVGNVRLIVPVASCDDQAAEALLRERNELDLADSLDFIGSALADSFAALRAAHVAVAFGQPIVEVRTAIDPLWFDVPVVAFDDPIVREAIEPCGIVAETRDAIELALIVKLIMLDRELREALVGEGRRVRARYAPEAAVKSLVESFESLGDSAMIHRRAD